MTSFDDLLQPRAWEAVIVPGPGRHPFPRHAAVNGSRWDADIPDPTAEPGEPSGPSAIPTLPLAEEATL